MRRMAEVAFRSEQWSGRYADHVAPLNRLVDLLRASKGVWAPYVAPLHGGVAAQVLSVLRDPGPKTEEVKGSGLLCVENDDPTAEAQARLFAEYGVGLERVTPWNAYPWRLGRAPTAGELEEGVGPLLEVVDVMPDLRVVLLQGGHAQDVWRRALRRRPQLEAERGIRALGTYHPGRQALRTPDPLERQRRLDDRRSAYREVAALVGSRCGPAPRGTVPSIAPRAEPERCIDAIAHLADWSPWVPLAEAAETAPVVPGVYIAREGPDGPVVYAGMAGERAAGAAKRRGVRGRLRVYAAGKGAVSGLGEASLDRALADPVWLARRLAEVQSGAVRRTQEWARLALERADVHVCWAGAADVEAARLLEGAVLAALTASPLWNRRRP